MSPEIVRGVVWFIIGLTTGWLLCDFRAPIWAWIKAQWAKRTDGVF